jgi:hypothetical protein
MQIVTLFYLCVAGTFVLAYARLVVLDVRRRRAVRRLGQMRGTDVVTLVHRLETVTLLGLPLYRYVSTPLGSEVLASLRRIPDERPVDLLVHLPAGVAVDAPHIARALRRRTGAVTLIVPACALSGGRTLAEAADTVIVGPGAAVADAGEGCVDVGDRGAGSDDDTPLPRAVWSLLALYAQPPRRRGSPLLLPLNRRGRTPAAGV